MSRMTIGIVLFDGFETLDAMGPVELFGMVEERFEIVTIAETGPTVRSAQGPRTAVDRTFDQAGAPDLLLVPGGPGTRREVRNDRLLGWLKEQEMTARYVTSVCTGSALLARAGLLDGRRATSNKKAFRWVMDQGPHVDWIYEARWVEDGRFWTSSGVSAGMDMALALIARLTSLETAENAAIAAEYEWHRDPDTDPFARHWERPASLP